MKRSILFTLMAFSLSSCKNNQADPASFDWLLGHWVRTNGENGFKTHEIWKKQQDYYQGFGYTILNEDTIFKEELKLQKKDSLWVFQVTGENETPKPFVLSTLKKQEFIAENDTNEFPKKILYKLQLDTLRANISSPEFDVDFKFVKR